VLEPHLRPLAVWKASGPDAGLRTVVRQAERNTLRRELAFGRRASGTPIGGATRSLHGFRVVVVRMRSIAPRNLLYAYPFRCARASDEAAALLGRPIQCAIG
jgi:hypothetical protein